MFMIHYIYSDLDEVTKRKLMRVFGLSKITVHLEMYKSKLEWLIVDSLL